MKIAFIITRADDLGGAQTHVIGLAGALQERGHEVTVLAGLGGTLFESLVLKGVSCRLLTRLIHPISPLEDWMALKEIKAILSELKPDLVTTHSNKAGLLGRMAASSLKIPVVHTSHGFLFSGRDKSAAGLFYRLMEKWAAAKGTMVIAVSESEFEAARRLKVIPEEKMTVIYNGLPDLGSEFRADPAIDPCKMVMVARFEEPKDHMTLLEALGGLKNYNWTLQLIGEGRGLQRASDYVSGLGIDDRVEFSGMREDVPEILAGSSLFVLSSRREGFPISILEAMRAGLPVVASDVGGIGEAVAEGETGFLFPAGDAVTLRFQLIKLLDSPDLRVKMGQAGRERFFKQFVLDIMVERTESLYIELINEENYSGEALLKEFEVRKKKLNALEEHDWHNAAEKQMLDAYSDEDSKYDE